MGCPTIFLIKDKPLNDTHFTELGEPPFTIYLHFINNIIIIGADKLTSHLIGLLNPTVPCSDFGNIHLCEM